MSAPDLSEVEHPSYDRLPPWEIREMHSDFEIPEPEEVACPGCGGLYKRVGSHWQYNPECRPKLTEHQRDLVTGLLVGDGTLDRSWENPYLKVNMVTPRYLQHLDAEFGVLSTGVRLNQTATQKARNARETGFYSHATAEDYQDLYAWQTRSLPELEEFNWYTDNGKKRWPDDIELTPTVLRTWYVGDGCYSNSGASDCIKISLSNEWKYTDKVDAYFESAGLPTPSNYHTSEREDGSMKCDAAFSVDASRELWERMSPAPPGFEYKWPDEYC